METKFVFKTRFVPSNSESYRISEGRAPKLLEMAKHDADRPKRRSKERPLLGAAIIQILLVCISPHPRCFLCFVWDTFLFVQNWIPLPCRFQANWCLLSKKTAYMACPEQQCWLLNFVFSWIRLSRCDEPVSEQNEHARRAGQDTVVIHHPLLHFVSSFAGMWNVVRGIACKAKICGSKNKKIEAMQLSRGQDWYASSWPSWLSRLTLCRSTCQVPQCREDCGSCAAMPCCALEWNMDKMNATYFANTWDSHNCFSVHGCSRNIVFRACRVLVFSFSKQAEAEKIDNTNLMWYVCTWWHGPFCFSLSTLRGMRGFLFVWFVHPCDLCAWMDVLEGTYITYSQVHVHVHHTGGPRLAFMAMYVCMYVCMHVCMWPGATWMAFIHTRTYIHTYAQIHSYIHKVTASMSWWLAHTRTYIHTRTHTYIEW